MERPPACTAICPGCREEFRLLPVRGSPWRLRLVGADGGAHAPICPELTQRLTRFNRRIYTYREEKRGDRG